MAISRKSHNSSNRFMVGDVKQSIYKFRHSNPELFMEKYNNFLTSDLGIRIDLSKNFRSRKNVLAGVNFLFRQLMSDDVGEVTYDQSAFLNPFANFPERLNDVSEDIEVFLLNLASQDEQCDDEIGDDLKKLSSIEFEAKFVGMRILQLVDSNFQVYDKGCGYRDISFRDIAVLLRTASKWDIIFVSELINMGIPAFTNSTTGFFDTVEIMTMVSLLSVIDNPRQDIHLITVLHSPIFSFTADELASIRYIGENFTFFDSISQFVIDSDDTVLSDKLNNFLDVLKRWRDLAVYSSIVDLIWIVYNDTNYMSIVAAMPGGSIRQANLRMLTEKAAIFESGSLNGLFNFILFIENIKRTDSDIGEATLSSASEDVVSIMTVHKSKGLEFPVVFVCGLGKLFNLQDSRDSILLHQKLGIASDYVDYISRVKYNTIAKSALSIKIMQESLSEELRILYVALTRAREKLILTGTVKGLEKKATDWCAFNNIDSIGLPIFYMLNASCPLDWIMPALCRHRDGHVIRDISCLNNVNISDIYNDESVFLISVISKDDVSPKERKNNERYAVNVLRDWDINKQYSDFKDDIFKKLNWKYEYSNAVNIPSNISISEIKRRFQLELLNEHDTPHINGDNLNVTFESSISRLPAFMKNLDTITNAEVGVAFHTVLQHLNFNTVQNIDSLNLLLNDLLLKGLITEEQKDKINIRSILNFVNSDIVNRIRLSNKVYKETPFVYGMSPNDVYFDVDSDDIILIHGIIDLYFEENDEIILLDYKTDFVTPSSINEIRDKYKIQISIYKRALERITGKHVRESMLYLFGINQVLNM